MGTTIEPGSPAPGFEAEDHEGVTRRLEDYEGRGLVLYFYPEDGTPGCIEEACGFREAMDRYQAAGLAVVGVSTDSRRSHQAFAEEHDLNFPLLVDEGNEISKAYGAYQAWRRLPVDKRITYLVDGDGIVRDVWEAIDPAKHAMEVLERARELGVASEPAGA